MTPERKKASWLELFYDLAFVALIAQLTYTAAKELHSFVGALDVFIIGYSIFIIWWGTTANRNLQDSEGIADKLLIQLQMVGAFLMSITMPGVFVGDYAGFFLTLAVVRMLQVAMALRMYRLNPSTAPKTKNIVQGMTIASGMWCVAAFIPMPYHYVVAMMALLLEIFTPVSTGKGNVTRLLNVHHLQERLGLFLLLVMGESLLVVALANTATSITITTPLIVLSGVILTISLWWIYFEHLEHCGEGKRPQNLFVYLHAHGFLFGSIILLAAAYKNALLHSSPTFFDALLLFLGALGGLISITIMRLSLHGYRKRFVRVVILFAFIYLLLVGAVLFKTNAILSVFTVTTLFTIVYAIVDQKANRYFFH